MPIVMLEKTLLLNPIRKVLKREKKKGWNTIKFDIDIPTPYSELKEDEKEFWYLPYNRCLSNQEIDYLVSIVAAVREGVGKDVDVAIDCHWKYTVKRCNKIIKGPGRVRLVVGWKTPFLLRI